MSVEKTSPAQEANTMQSEIPEDVMKAAQDAFAKLADTYGSSAAMVFPIARAIMTERERHVSTILTGEMIEAAKSAYSECEFRTDEQVNSSITLIVRAALEAALSTDAEPVAIYKGNGLVDCGDSGHHNIELLKLIPANTPLYAEPVKTTPAVAVKALEWEVFGSHSGNSKADTPLGEYVLKYEGLGFDAMWILYLPHQDARHGKGHDTIESAKAAAQADYEARIRPALSAQVQDVAVPEAKPEKKVKPDRSKFPYVWEGPKPDEAIIHQVINAYMGAQEREYDIDQFRYYKANWHWHYTINQHMKAAVDAASPASKHGDAE